MFKRISLADYFHLDPSLVTMNPFKSKISKHLWNLPVLAEDPGHVVPSRGHCLQFYWPMEYEVSAILPEPVQVFQYQASSKYLPQILGYSIEGWRLLQKSQRRPKQLLSKPVCFITHLRVDHWILKDEASSIPSLFAALRQLVRS